MTLFRQFKRIRIHTGIDLERPMPLFVSHTVYQVLWKLPELKFR